MLKIIPAFSTQASHSPDLVVLWHTSNDLISELQLLLEVLLQRLQDLATEVPVSEETS